MAGKIFKNKSKMALKSSTLAKIGAGAYTLLSAAQHWAKGLENTFRDSSLPAYISSKVNDGCGLGAVAAGTFTLDRIASSIDDLVTPNSLRALKGAVPLAAATIGIGALLNEYGGYFGIPEGYGALTITKHLVLNYGDAVIDLFAGKDVNPGYLTGAAITLTSALRLGKNMLKTAMERGDKNRIKAEYKAKAEKKTTYAFA